MKITSLGLVVAMAGVMGLSGCLKSSDDTVLPPAKTYVSVMHLAPTGPSLDVFFNTTKVSDPAFAPGNVTVAYNAVDKGTFAIRFKKAGTDSLVTEIPTAQYDSLNYYTLFIYNTQANGPVQAVRIKDDYSVLTQQDKPYYRFFHASPNTDAVDLYIDNVKIENGRLPADNASNDALNKFTATTAGNHTVEARLAGTNTVVATNSNIFLLAGSAYTFYLKGLTGGSGTSELTIGLLRAQD